MAREKIDSVARELQKFNLTEYQAKALAGMLSIGEGTAADLMAVTTVPKARIYQILDELLEMGALRKKPGRPTRYSALKAEEALQNIIDFRLQIATKESESLSTLKDSIVSEVTSNFSPAPLEKKRSFMEMIPAGELSEMETRKLYSSAKKSICIMSGVFEYLPRVLTDLKNARKKGVKIKVLMKEPSLLQERGRSIQSEVIPVLKKIGANVKFTKEMPMRLTLADHKQAVFSVDEGRNMPFLKEVCISENENMVKALEHYFNSYWK